MDVNKADVFVGGWDPDSNLPVYHLYIYTWKEGDLALESDHYSLIDKTYSILTKEKVRWKWKKTLWNKLEDSLTSSLGSKLKARFEEKLQEGD